MKKGFTLIELLGVIILLGILALIVYPIVDSSIKKSRESAYTRTIDGIINAARLYGTNHNLGYTTEPKILSLDLLKENGYLQNDDIRNPMNNEILNGCVVYTWDEIKGQYKYSYEADKSNCIIATDATCFSYENIKIPLLFDVNPENCTTYFSDKGYSEQEVQETCQDIKRYLLFEPAEYFDHKQGGIEGLIDNHVISNVTYEEGVIITGYSSSCTEKDLIFPNTINDKPVLVILGEFGDRALTSLDFQLSNQLVTLFGHFYLNNFNKIDISHLNSTYISKQAFACNPNMNKNNFITNINYPYEYFDFSYRQCN